MKFLPPTCFFATRDVDAKKEMDRVQKNRERLGEEGLR